MNFKLTLQYEGTDFHGWQIQTGQRTVQGELSRVLSLLDGHPVIVHGSGRTDAGVHAEGQVASTQLERSFTPERLRAAINANVERDLRVLAVDIVMNDFHARYSAIGKSYVYRIVNGPVISPFWVRYAHHESRLLDIEAMAETAKVFLGHHDWTAFSAAQSDVQSRVRTIEELAVTVHDDSRSHSPMIEIKVTADGFLRYMVRNISGALLSIGRHEIEVGQIVQAIETGARPVLIATAPACGLTLVSVSYPSGFAQESETQP